MQYTAVLHHSEEGIAVSAQELPGCWSQGTTEAEALDNIRDAIREYVLARRQLFAEDGTSTRVVDVKV